MNSNPANESTDREVGYREDPTGPGMLSYPEILAQNESARQRALDHYRLMEVQRAVDVAYAALLEQGVLLEKVTTRPNIDELSGAERAYGGPEEWAGVNPFEVTCPCGHCVKLRERTWDEHQRKQQSTFKRMYHSLQSITIRVLNSLRFIFS